MRCDEIRRRLSEYLDGELPPEGRQSVEEHLSGCEGCRKELSELELTLGHLRSLHEVEPPPFYTQSVMRRVREEARAKPGLLRKLFFPLRVKLPIEAMAVALVAVVAVYVFKAMGPEVAMRPPTVASAPETADEMASLRPKMEDKAAPAEGGRDLENEMEEAGTGEGRALKEAAEPEYGAGRKAEPSPLKRAMRDSAAPTVEAEAPRDEKPAREEFRLAPGAKGLVAGREDYEISVWVPCPEEAEEAFEAAVETAGGKVIEKESSAGERGFYVEIAPEKITPLVHELWRLGDVGDVRSVSEAAEGDTVVVRIRLRQRA